MAEWLVGIGISERFVHCVWWEHAPETANYFSLVPLAPPSSITFDKF